MLVLTRKRDEIIVINGNITVQVLEILGGVVKLGVVAPKEIPIERSERLKKKQEGKSNTTTET